MNRDILYPEADPKQSGFLEVSKNPPHELYWEEYGNSVGEPVLFVHGGPGSGSKRKYARYFDPDHYRIILFDQRGAGKSKPNASLEDNTTAHLIEDIVKLREHLGIKGKVHLFGGSWGSTLSLAYAINHPETVKSMTLRGIFLGRKRDIDFFYQGNAADLGNDRLKGAGQLFSDKYHQDKWHEYVEFIPQEERSDMVAAYRKRLTEGDEATKLEAARRWVMWESAASRRTHSQNLDAQYTNVHHILTLAQIENHYAFHGIFWNELAPRQQNYILDNIDVVAEIPAEIVQGRYDMVCSQDQASSLYEASKKAQRETDYPVKLHLVDDAGHSASEPGMAEKLIEITNSFRYLDHAP